ncbi:hypothetical protein IAT40_007704 [Kwoniella sp. CBS 6097]
MSDDDWGPCGLGSEKPEPGKAWTVVEGEEDEFLNGGPSGDTDDCFEDFRESTPRSESSRTRFSRNFSTPQGAEDFGSRPTDSHRPTRAQTWNSGHSESDRRYTEQPRFHHSTYSPRPPPSREYDSRASDYFQPSFMAQQVPSPASNEIVGRVWTTEGGVRQGHFRLDPKLFCDSTISLDFDAGILTARNRLSGARATRLLPAAHIEMDLDSRNAPPDDRDFIEDLSLKNVLEEVWPTAPPSVLRRRVQHAGEQALQWRAQRRCARTHRSSRYPPSAFSDRYDQMYSRACRDRAYDDELLFLPPREAETWSYTASNRTEGTRCSTRVFIDWNL